MKLRFKTLFINAIATLIVSNAAFANTANQQVELTLQQEVEQHLQLMVTNIQAPTINTDVVKQLDRGYLIAHTNKLVKTAGELLPKYKFRVVIAD